jgi:hypothetical protein
MNRSRRRHAFDGFVRAACAPGEWRHGFVREDCAPTILIPHPSDFISPGAVASFARIARPPAAPWLRSRRSRTRQATGWVRSRRFRARRAAPWLRLSYFCPSASSVGRHFGRVGFVCMILTPRHAANLAGLGSFARFSMRRPPPAGRSARDRQCTALRYQARKISSDGKHQQINHAQIGDSRMGRKPSPTKRAIMRTMSSRARSPD